MLFTTWRLGRVPLEVSSAVIFDLRCDFTDDEDMQRVQWLFDFEHSILSLKLISLKKYRFEGPSVASESRKEAESRGFV